MQIGASASLGHEYCKLLLAMKDQLWRSGSRRSRLHKAQRSAMEVRKSMVKVTQGTKGLTDVDQTCRGKVA